MFKVTFWLPETARTVERRHVDRPMCQEDDGPNWPCSNFPHFVLCWAVNSSGLPNSGTARVDYFCVRHLGERLLRITEEEARYVTVTRYVLLDASED